MAAMIATAQVKRARFAFTIVTSSRVVRHQTGNRAALGWPRLYPKIPGFASPPRDGFALDDLSDGERLSSSSRTLGIRSNRSNDPLVPFPQGVRGSFRDAPPAARDAR